MPARHSRNPPSWHNSLASNISVARSPKSLIWPGKTALLWAQEAKGMSSTASSPHLFFSMPYYSITKHRSFEIVLEVIDEFRVEKSILKESKRVLSSVGVIFVSSTIESYKKHVYVSIVKLRFL
ncbi:hypothetical protein ACB092_05G142500 [Castanea dentata]